MHFATACFPEFAALLLEDQVSHSLSVYSYIINQHSVAANVEELRRASLYSWNTLWNIQEIRITWRAFVRFFNLFY